MPTSIVSSVTIQVRTMNTATVRDGILKAIREIPLAGDPTTPSPDSTHLRFWPVLNSAQESFVISVLDGIMHQYADEIVIHYYEFTDIVQSETKWTDLRIIVAGEKTIQVIRDRLKTPSVAPK